MRQERSTLRTVVAALAFLLVGVLLLVLGNDLEVDWARILALGVGSFIIASVVLALIFEQWQLEGLLEDLYDQAGIVEQVRRSGISGFSTLFHGAVPWEQLFATSKRLRFVFAYGSTWRNVNQHGLEQFVGRKDSAFEVVLPDPEARVLIDELAHRFSMTAADLVTKIEEARAFFESLSVKSAGALRIYYFSRSLVYSSYIFDTKCIFTSYRHRPGRGGVVTILANAGGEFYEWLEQEWHGIIEEGLKDHLTRLVYEKP